MKIKKVPLKTLPKLQNRTPFVFRLTAPFTYIISNKHVVLITSLTGMTRHVKASRNSGCSTNGRLRYFRIIKEKRTPISKTVDVLVTLVSMLRCSNLPLDNEPTHISSYHEKSV